jgi:O-antigen/teichoic acid export membrane protein
MILAPFLLTTRYNQIMKLSKTRVTIFVNTASQVVGKIASAATTVIISLLLANGLGKQGYGDFSKVTTYVAFFYLLVDMGLNAAFLQQQEEDANLTFQHLLGLRLVISVVASFLAVSLLSLLPQGQDQGYTTIVRIGIILYAGTIVAQGVITTTNAVFQKQLEYKRATIAVIIGSLITLGGIVFFGSTTLLGTLVIFLVGSWTTMALAIIFCRPFVPSVTPRFSSTYWRSLLVTALPLSITLVFNLIYFRIDSIVLTLTQPTAAVGIYNFAYKIFELPLVFPIFFMNALFPLFVKEITTNPQSFWRHGKESAVFLGITAIGTTIALWIGAPVISIVSPGFADAIVVVRILSLGIPFFFLSALTMWMLITIKKRQLLVGIYGLSMIGNIIAGIYPRRNSVDGTNIAGMVGVRNPCGATRGLSVGESFAEEYFNQATIVICADRRPTRRHARNARGLAPGNGIDRAPDDDGDRNRGRVRGVGHNRNRHRGAHLPRRRRRGDRCRPAHVLARADHHAPARH